MSATDAAVFDATASTFWARPLPSSKWNGRR